MEQNMFCMSHFWVIDESSDECVRANEGVYEGTKGKIGGKYLVYQKYFFYSQFSTWSSKFLTRDFRLYQSKKSRKRILKMDDDEPVMVSLTEDEKLKEPDKLF